MQEVAMRGDDRKQTHMFSYISLEERVPKEPLRNSNDLRRFMSGSSVLGMGIISVHPAGGPAGTS